MKIFEIIKYILQPFLLLIGAIFLGYREGKNSAQKRDLDEELQSIRESQKRRAKRDSDSDSVVTNRLRADARKE